MIEYRQSITLRVTLFLILLFPLSKRPPLLLSMQTQPDPANENKDGHPIITLGLLTAGSQLGSTLIQRMARHPVLLFAMGAATGAYVYKNRKEILAEAQQLKQQGQKLLSKKVD